MLAWCFLLKHSAVIGLIFRDNMLTCFIHESATATRNYDENSCFICTGIVCVYISFCVYRVVHCSAIQLWRRILTYIICNGGVAGFERQVLVTGLPTDLVMDPDMEASYRKVWYRSIPCQTRLEIQ